MNIKNLGDMSTVPLIINLEMIMFFITREQAHLFGCKYLLCNSLTNVGLEMHTWYIDTTLK